ncbi:MAG: 3-deoxy-7-phosphoheptulonate synthase [Giesbergeria sp.]|nr:3-deoxy-7-phosphoheptulonate synthase [Giesbergeria sp.]MBP8092030.1 3-deoxy-7-phosphoheptulonate synthase [Giesbergeria sp.]
MTAHNTPATSDSWYRSVEKTSQTDDERIKDITVLPPPEHLIRFFPIRATAVEGLVSQTRQNIHRIMRGQDDRLLVVIGPCSIHDPAAALDYARRLQAVREQYQDTLEIVMRVYFEKPRTTVGWKGLINDPYLDESYRIDEGLRIARQLLIEINRLGVPAGSEFLDVISPQYIGDLISWGAIGARTTESQVHRELASGLSAPIGFKNGTDGNIRIATDAIQSASRSHHFLSVHKSGQVAIVDTEGNPDCHVILRGGKAPNYDAHSVAAACQDLVAAKLPASLMVDCSHANSSKQHEKQKDVASDIAAQIAGGSHSVFGVMIESHLQAGAQKFTAGKDLPSALEYGKSITDACLGWEDSLQSLAELAAAVQARRNQQQPQQLPATGKAAAGAAAATV